MIPPPAPLIIQKERFRLVFNEPHERGCVSIECESGGVCIFLDDADLMKLSGAALSAARRIRKNRLVPLNPS